jgi:hypothetical protein
MESFIVNVVITKSVWKGGWHSPTGSDRPELCASSCSMTQAMVNYSKDRHDLLAKLTLEELIECVDRENPEPQLPPE